MSRRSLCVILALVVVPVTSRAELIALEATRREPFAGGQEFGTAGAYERIIGIARFALDPADARNRGIVDLDLAPRNAQGKVEFAADVFILAPKTPAKGNGALLYDVNNRGSKLALGMFNSGRRSNDPKTAEDAGNGFLFRRGYTVVWCGWIGELLPGDGRMLLQPPPALENGKPVRGRVRFEIVSDEPAETMPLARREGHGSYPLTEAGERQATMTWRMRETDQRVRIPREQWSIERQPLPPTEGGVPGTLSQARVRLAGGFRPGYIYEVIAECEGAFVQGCGFAAVRDLISFLKYDASDRNPVKGAISRAHGFGVSQSGRFLREFAYFGFNADERGRRVFDGLIPHVAGGGLGHFNHRFAQPTRHNGQHEEHLYPADRFPFAYETQTDPFTGRVDGVLKRLAETEPKAMPKVFHTQSSSEYWHRSGSLVHTDAAGKVDSEPPANVRLYTFGGTQHGPATDPPGRGIADNLLNPADYKPQLRALLDALDAWVKDGTEPPASVVPTIRDKTLVPWSQAAVGFPALPGVRYPEVIQQPPVADHGPDFSTRGILSVLPPRVSGHYVVLVPRTDSDGHELGCLDPIEVKVPLATYTSWNLRRREAGAEGMLAGLMGSYLPFPKTKAERVATGDPRRSIEERYASFDAYLTRCREACAAMTKARHLLEEDAERFLKSREKVRPLFAQ